MGADGLRRATAVAILSANYVARRLDAAFPVLYTGEHGDVAHECIIDLRPITKATGVTVDDVAKRLMDYGFHAPTMSFPVAGTLMVEPTESEARRELDRFCDAMIAIRAEIDRVAAGDWPVDDNPLAHAPAHGRGRGRRRLDRAPTPASWPPSRWPALRVAKYFPPVCRIDAAYGDRNLMCSCPPIEEYVLSRRSAPLRPPPRRWTSVLARHGADCGVRHEGCQGFVTNGSGTTWPARAVPRTSTSTAVPSSDVGREEAEGDAVAEHRREVAAGHRADGPPSTSTGALGARRPAALGGDAPQAPGHAPLALGLERRLAAELPAWSTPPPSRARPAAA